ncbi:MAG: hypothetical protein PHO02_04710 [Candidatus Nanoarchaeia archaeon]|nr:hypothetical protein [Candidatus Nanoarchaeia archaeon]
MGKMRLIGTARKLEGMNTIEGISRAMGINQKKAIELMHRMRKKGFVKTKGGGKQKRFYYISPERLSTGTSLYEIINKYAPSGAKVQPIHEYIVHGRRVTEEEALIFAIESESIRAIIASLSLFKHITQWTLLSKLADKPLKRKICALYGVAKTILKVRKMPERFKKSAVPCKKDKYTYIARKIGSKDFKQIEKAWKVYIPLNKADLEEYKI